jgi:two-component system alkaline phosphatase synthesis response regulator PhoP
MRRLLIVEDDRDMNASIMDVLVGEGFSCVSTFDGQRGLEVLAHERPALVLLDLALPGMDGFEFLERKAATPSIAEIPVVVMTAQPHPPPIASAVAVIRKPFSLGALLAVVRNFLSKHPS